MSKIHSFLFLSAFTLHVVSGCTNSSTNLIEPQWPKASMLTPQPLPPNVTWRGVYFIHTGGTTARGYMHVLTSGPERVMGCWIAEDKHAIAKFTGTVQQNIAKLDWTERFVGGLNPPTRVSAYLVLTRNPETQKIEVKGEYGDDIREDSGNKWEGVLQRNLEPTLDNCKIEAGEAVQLENKPLE